MDKKFKTECLDARAAKDIVRAAELLRRGGTVAFPTETVYGLGANALSPQAVAKIFAAKQRPAWDPLIVHIADRQVMSQICSPAWSFRSGAAEPSVRIANRLMDAFWPGPLTLLLPRTQAIPDAVTAGRPLVGVRMPAHPVALELIRQAGFPIAAPSANTFGHTSPTTAAHVLADLDGRIDAVLDGGACQVGLESTVAGFVPDEETGYPHLMVYRAGAISIDILERELGAGAVALYRAPHRPQDAIESLPSPGVGIRHYAPVASLTLVQSDRDLVHAIDAASDGIETIGVLLPDGWNSSCAQLVFRWGPWHDTETLAQRLYAGLRELDDRGATVIICPVPTSGALAAALRDRLEKAARR